MEQEQEADGDVGQPWIDRHWVLAIWLVCALPVFLALVGAGAFYLGLVVFGVALLGGVQHERERRDAAIQRAAAAAYVEPVIRRGHWTGYPHGGRHV